MCSREVHRHYTTPTDLMSFIIVTATPNQCELCMYPALHGYHSTRYTRVYLGPIGVTIGGYSTPLKKHTQRALLVCCGSICLCVWVCAVE